MNRTGHCLCAATTYTFAEDHILWQGLCHCEDCRRATGAPMVGWFGVADGHWNWTGQPPGTYASSPGATRTFCTTCGTPLSFASIRWPDETHFLAATLSDPENFRPTAEYYTHAELPWTRATGMRRFHTTSGV